MANNNNNNNSDDDDAGSDVVEDNDEVDNNYYAANNRSLLAKLSPPPRPVPSLYALCFAELADQARDHTGWASQPRLQGYWRLAGQVLAHLCANQPRSVRGRHLLDLAGPGIVELDLAACCLLSPADLRAALPACRSVRRLRLAQCSQLVLDKRLLTDLPRLAPRLRCLELDQCDSLTGAALRCVLLSGRRRLRHLSAAACPLVCDAAFAGLPADGGRLRRVNVSGTQVSCLGLRDLVGFSGRCLRSLTASHLADLRLLFDCLAEANGKEMAAANDRMKLQDAGNADEQLELQSVSSYYSCNSGGTDIDYQCQEGEPEADNDFFDNLDGENFEVDDSGDSVEYDEDEDDDELAAKLEPLGLAELDLACCTSWPTAHDSLLHLCGMRGRWIRSLSLASAAGITEAAVSAVCHLCPGLIWLSLRGCRLQLAGLTVALSGLAELCGLDLSELLVTEPADFDFLSRLTKLRTLQLDGWEDVTPGEARRLLASLTSLPQLRCLSLNWCPQLTQEACRDIGASLAELRQFACRCNLADGTDLEAVIAGCGKLESLDLSFIKGTRLVTDRLLYCIAGSLQQLVKLDVSFNPFITDRGVSAILKACPSLQEADFSGLKQITCDPFLPIIHDLLNWRRTLALLRLRLAERAAKWRRRAAANASANTAASVSISAPAAAQRCPVELPPDDDEANNEYDSSGDEDFEELELPRRSRVYAPNLRTLRLLVSDLINDDCMREIVAVCRGSLAVYGYYADSLEPRWITINPGRQRVLESALLSADV